MLGEWNLSSLKPGEGGRIAGFTLEKEMEQRFQAMGLVRGTTVKCLYKSPLGDPAAYLVKGAVIAIRKEDSGRIFIRNEAPEKEAYRKEPDGRKTEGNEHGAE